MRRVFWVFLFFGLVSCASQNSTDELTVAQKKAQLYYDHGTALLIDKKYTEALDYLIQASQLNPDRSDIQNNLGMAYYFKKSYKNAEKHLKKALDLNPKNEDARNNLASLLFNQHRYREAQQEYLKVTKNLVYNKQYRIYYNLALLAQKFGQPDMAINYLKKSLQEKNDYCVANLKLGQLEQNNLNYQQALKHYKKARMGTCYKYAAPHYYLGSLYLQLGNIIAAQEAFHTLIDKFSDSYYAKMAKLRLKELHKFDLKKDPQLSKKLSHQNNKRSY